MGITETILLVIAIVALLDPLTHTFAERWYKNHPYAEKTAYFETLDVVFRHKPAKIISIAAGVLCMAAAVLIQAA